MNIKTYGDPKHPAILLLHGGGVGGWMWEDQINYFQKDCYLLVPELPLLNPQFKIQETALELNRIIAKQFKNKPVILVGFSIGAQISIAMIGENSSLFQAAIINSALVLPIQHPLMDITLNYSYPLMRSRLFAKVQAYSMGIPKQFFNTYFEESLKLSKDAFLNMMKENMSFQVPENFYSAKIPILFTMGKNEQKMVERSFELLKKRSFSATGYIFEKSAHNAPFKESARFNQLIDQWLNEVLKN